MDHPPPTTPRSAAPGLARRAVKWGVVVAFALAAALWIDLARQAVATDRVEWREFSGLEVVTVNGAAPAETSAAEPTGPRLLYFTADWCGPCRLLKSQVFAKPRVAEAIHARFSAYRIDQSRPSPEQVRLAQAYAVHTIPTLLIVDEDGTPLGRLNRVVEAEEFLEWLDRGWDRWQGARPQPAAGYPVLTQNQPLP